jgi:hypothetical protein
MFTYVYMHTIIYPMYIYVYIPIYIDIDKHPLWYISNISAISIHNPTNMNRINTLGPKRSAREKSCSKRAAPISGDAVGNPPRVVGG